MNILRDHFFKKIDSVLPRELAALPYQFALKSLQTDFCTNLIAGDVWSRNSFKQGNYVFGVSDLDVTFYLNQKVFTSRDFWMIQNILTRTKRLYPFLGEVNLYLADLAQEFSSSINYHERLRDPVLNILLPPIDPKNKLADDVTFLLRMLHSDRHKLLHYPHLRRKKWSMHLTSVLEKEIPDDSVINFDYVVEAILCHVTNDDQLKDKLRGPLLMFKNPLYNDDEIYFWGMPAFWKFLYPNRYLWFERDDQKEGWQDFLDAGLFPITLRQIEWELWGLMSQYPFLSDHKWMFEVHFQRLIKLARTIDPATNLPAKLEHFMDSLKQSFRL